MMKKKILFMVQVPPPIHGAALRNLSLYESELLHETFDIKLLPLAFAGSIDDIGKLSVKKLLKSFLYAFTLSRTFICYKPDIVYFTITPSGSAFYRDCLFILILKMFNVKIVYHLRGLGVKKGREKNWLSKILYRFAFKNVYVICLGKVQFTDIEGLPYKKHYVVPNGIKTETEPQWITENSNGRSHILFLSNFVRSKGVFEFLQAMKKLKEKHSNFEALMIGDNFDITLEEVNDFINKNGLGSNVKANGPRYKAEKFKTVGSCDIFVMPTYFELFPGVLLEAMQCGKPIVSTTTGAIPEIIDDGVNGLLVEPKNVDQLTEKIYHLIQYPEKAKSFGNAAKEKFNREFTLTKFEENMKSVFEQVLAEKN
jgi:glycosyltransferase involved in cell wall biosynthesis